MPFRSRTADVLGIVSALAVIMAAGALPTTAQAAEPLAHGFADPSTVQPADPDFAGYTSGIPGIRTTKSTVVVPSSGTCNSTERGVAALLMQSAGPRYAGVRVFALCRSGVATYQVDIVTNERGLEILPASHAGDRLQVTISENDGNTIVLATNLTRGWRERTVVASIGATKYIVGDSLVGSGGVVQPMVDFGSHAFTNTTVSRKKLGTTDPRRDSTTDLTGAHAIASRLVDDDTFLVTYTAP